MDNNIQSLLAIALTKALKKIKLDNAIISIDRVDDKLTYKNKLGKEFEIILPKAEKGEKGDPGLSIKGEKGDPGLSIKGEKGDPGLSIKGEKGDRGLEAAPGKSIKGDRGLRGLQGLPGKSIKGDKGDKGDSVDLELLAKNIEFKIDRFGHLIVTIFGKKTDLGRVKSFGGGGGISVPVEFKYTNLNPMPAPVGGFPEGTTFDNVDQKTMWTDLLYGADRPAFTSFYINLESTIFEVGDHILADTYQATWHMTYPEFLEPNSIKIDYIHDNIVTNLASNLPNIQPADVNIPDIAFTAPKTIAFKLTGSSSTEGNFSRSMLVSFLSRIYVGESKDSVLTSNDIKALRITQLADNINGEYQTEAGGYKWFCYPVYMGQRYNFIDESTEIEVSMDDVKTISVTNDFGVTQDYYAYRSYNVLHAALKIKVY